MAASRNKLVPERSGAIGKPSHELVSPESASTRIDAALYRFFASRLITGARVCVALSGGRDSIVLLHALCRMRAAGTLDADLSAIHVHHALSPNADHWAEFCAEFCQRHSLSLAIVRVAVARDSSEGLEAAARRARHAAFATCSADWLALAQHRDDQAETVLLNLLRGAGVAGAAGMLPERPQAAGPLLVRPLLDVPRRLLEDYANEQGLAWIDDESNDDLHFRRNFLRRAILPQLEDHFPGARKSLARAAGHFAEGQALLDDLARLDRDRLLAPSGRIALVGFNMLSSESPARARNLSRLMWIDAGFRAPDTRWIDEALAQLATAGTCSEMCMATADGELRVYRGELYFLLAHRPQPEPSAVTWNGEPELPWAGGSVRFVPVVGAGMRRDLAPAGEVCVRARQGGERLRPDARRPRRSLRNLLQEAAIPPWER
ncbi:MAG: tRNA lysidine(34) synthetase TilS, partial [Propionivibrio sp.]